MKTVKIENGNLLMKELEGLDFAEFIYCEDLDEGYLEVKGKSKFINFMCKVFTIGKLYHNHIIIQVLKHKKNGEHYIYFDDLNRVETIEQLNKILDIASKFAILGDNE